MEWEKLTFNSRDGLEITADYYAASSPRGFMLLCHRSHSNRAEYRETAPRFNQLGLNCLAIDQRSGMKVFGETNETKDRAKQARLPTGYLDARIDVEAAVDHAFSLNGDKPVVLLGSSYSASLALLVGAHPDRVKAVIGFSPGEYLKGVSLADEIRGLNKPAFVTSARSEIEQVADVVRNVDPALITHFQPEVEGFHGSKALWQSVEGSETYWTALTSFLESIS